MYKKNKSILEIVANSIVFSHFLQIYAKNVKCKKLKKLFYQIICKFLFCNDLKASLTIILSGASS